MVKSVATLGVFVLLAMFSTAQASEPVVPESGEPDHETRGVPVSEAVSVQDEIQDFERESLVEGERPANEAVATDQEPASVIGLTEEDKAYARTLVRRGGRQGASTLGVLAAGAVFLIPLPIVGFPEGNCERNKGTCSSYSVGDFSSVADDLTTGVSFAGMSTALAGMGMLIAINQRNVKLGRSGQDARSLRAQRSVMLERYGRRTQWAAVGVISASAIAALTGGILYAKNYGACELGDCAVVPGASKAIITSAFIATVTGGMMLGVGTATRTRGVRGQERAEALSLQFAPTFARGGGGGSMQIVW